MSILAAEPTTTPATPGVHPIEIPNQEIYPNGKNTHKLFTLPGRHCALLTITVLAHDRDNKNRRFFKATEGWYHVAGNPPAKNPLAILYDKGTEPRIYEIATSSTGDDIQIAIEQKATSDERSRYTIVGEYILV